MVKALHRDRNTLREVCGTAWLFGALCKVRPSTVQDLNWPNSNRSLRFACRCSTRFPFPKGSLHFSGDYSVRCVMPNGNASALETLAHRSVLSFNAETRSMSTGLRSHTIQGLIVPCKRSGAVCWCCWLGFQAARPKRKPKLMRELPISPASSKPSRTCNRDRQRSRSSARCATRPSIGRRT